MLRVDGRRWKGLGRLDEGASMVHSIIKEHGLMMLCYSSIVNVWTPFLTILVRHIQGLCKRAQRFKMI